jgi:hypothetical protein
MQKVTFVNDPGKIALRNFVTHLSSHQELDDAIPYFSFCVIDVCSVDVRIHPITLFNHVLEELERTHYSLSQRVAASLTAAAITQDFAVPNPCAYNTPM